MATATNVTTAVPPWVVVEDPHRTGGGETPRLDFQTPLPKQCGRSRKSSRRSAGVLSASPASRPGRQGGLGEVGHARCRPKGPGNGSLGASRNGTRDWLTRGGGTGDARRLARFARGVGRDGPGRLPPRWPARRAAASAWGVTGSGKFPPKRLKKIERLFRSVILTVCNRSVAGRSALPVDFR